MKTKRPYPPLQTCRKCGCGVPDLKKHTCAPRPGAAMRRVFSLEEEKQIRDWIHEELQAVHK